MEQEFLADVILDIFEVSKAKEFIDSIWSCRDYAEVLQAARENPPAGVKGIPCGAECHIGDISGSKVWM